MPSPMDTLLRRKVSPVPNQTTFASLGATATALTDDTRSESVMGVQRMPPLVLLNRPPLAAPA
ncbi:MAG: hypothetical protein U5K74_11730 [Gemmatimonadaceae bacterium]|nr:hypothetical protein [Gemmatimonadaceae bacterium]